MTRTALLFALTFLAACTAPRANLETGRVTPRGRFVVGADVRGNLPTATTGAMYDSLKAGVNEARDAATGESPKWTGEDGRQKLAKLVDTLVIYSLDPLGWGFDFRARYGFYDHLDLGVRYDSGVVAGDVRFQFLGAINRGKKPNLFFNHGPRWHGSVGVQYSQQDFKVPLPILEDLQELLGYEFTRKDVLVPLAISYSLGPDELFGAITFGLAYNLGLVKYGFQEEKVAQLFQESLEQEGIVVPHDEKSVHAFGPFLNVKVGFKWIYAIASLSIYYQDYGSYDIFGVKTSRFSGLTFIPSFGVMGTF
jgi:hypothetical protein